MSFEQRKKQYEKEKEKCYEVEQILKTKNEDGRDFYLVKWTGFTSRWNSWEPAENFLNVESLLLEFSAREEAKGKNQSDLSSFMKTFCLFFTFKKPRDGKWL